jgi:hypothetical protein
MDRDSYTFYTRTGIERYGAGTDEARPTNSGVVEERALRTI